VFQSILFFIRHLQGVPNELASKKLYVGASFTDDNPRVSRRNMLASLGLKKGIVIAVKGYSQAVLISGGLV
jgi:hypothetical protein